MLSAYISLANFDFDLFGRAVFIIIIFALVTGVCFGAAAAIRKAFSNYKNRKTREYLSHKDIMKNVTIQDLMRLRKMEVPERDKDDFFFGPVSDWRKMK